MSADARRRILARIEAALADRPPVVHPGPFQGARPPEQAPGADPVADFAERFRSEGGEVVLCADAEAARVWLAERAAGAVGVCWGRGVPEHLRADAPALTPADAPLGVSMAWGAVAETGSLVMHAADGRAAQLLPPVHVIVVEAAAVRATLAEAFADLAGSLPAAVGLHSGPSKSADIGKVMVTGVHGPGRVVALVIGAAGP